MERGIEFDVIGIAETIKQNRFIVPPNQREYSWIKEVQVFDLLQDISLAMRNSEKPYFLGTIVLTSSTNGRLEVADGQQRLATTTMILAAIRNWFRSKGDSMMVNSIENDFLFTIDRASRERVPKLTLNLDDNEYFKNLILHPSHDRVHQEQQRRSHKLINEAFDYIENYIKNFENQGEEYAKSHLNDWIDYLEKKANVVMLTVSNADNAFKMFETLNDRGLKTSQVDLVKNHIFNKSEDRLSEAQRLWSAMRGTVESVSDDNDDVMIEYLRSVCCLMAGTVTKKEIMSVIRDRTPNKTESIRITTQFEELSKEYAAIQNPDHQKWNEYDTEIRRAIQTINLFGVTQIRPLMLAVSKYFNAKDASVAFKKFVSWSVRFMVLGMRGGRLDDGYSKLANKIYLREIKTIDDLTRESENLIIKDSEFQSAFEVAKVGTAKLARYYLRSLEITASGQDNPEYIPNDGSVINLEHIMPESITEAWPRITQQNIDSHRTRLGNLALMKAIRNNQIGNQSFEIKKEVYKESAYLLTQNIADCDSWGILQIEQRQKMLAELAVKTWQL